jgi:pre-mRNA-splicing factor ATP-dependent RNA helicase DHX16
MKRARDIREQLESLCDRVEIEKHSSQDNEQIAKAITSGFFYHTSKLQRNGAYRTVKVRNNLFMHEYR